MLEIKNNFKHCYDYEKHYKHTIPFNETIYGLLTYYRSVTPWALSMIKEIYITFSSCPTRHYLNIYSFKIVYNNIFESIIKIPKYYTIKINLHNPLIYFLNKHKINHKKHLQIGVLKYKYINDLPYNTIYSFEILN